MRGFLLLLLLQAISCSSLQTLPSTFYVSPNGDDSWSGRLAKANADATDGPFKTLEQARQAVRDYRDSRPTVEAIVVTLLSGDYRRQSAFILDERDSGSADQPIIWRGEGTLLSRLLGSARLDSWQIVTDSNLLRRLPESSRAAVRIADLPADLTLPEAWNPRGAPLLELFEHDKKLPMASYPQNGWLRIADVPQTGAKRFHEGLEREKRYDGVPVGRHYGRIQYDDPKPNRWQDWSNIWLHGYWTWDWSDAYQLASSVDTLKQEIILAEPHHNYGYTKNQRFRFLNILEELDEPGEWVFDRVGRRILLYPINPTAMEVEISVCASPLFHLRSCEHVRLENIAFAASRGNGVVIEGGKDNVIAGCRFSGLGNHAVEIHCGRHNGVQSCDITDVAMGGIVLDGGDRQNLLPAGHFAINNHIHHFSTWLRTWQLAIDLHGIGHHVSHNLIHDAPHEAIYVRGNDHLLEFNEIHSVCQETGDAGAIHTGRDYTWRGNIYRHNYIHDLQGAGLHGVTALYLDDFSSGYTLTGNLCVRSGRGTLVGGGRDNLVCNNVYIECFPSIILDGRGLSWAGYYFNGGYPVLFDKLNEMNAMQPPYSERYPELLSLGQGNPAEPVNNRIENNLSLGGRFIELYDFYAYDVSKNSIRQNCIADSTICKILAEPPSGWDPYYLDLDRSEGYRFINSPEDLPEVLADNLFCDQTPIEFDARKKKIRILNNKLRELGFAALPLDSMGLMKDRFRRRIIP
ncbi:MAG TPA: right-handed parallel beta-helix repeat-containing protein [bacterium]|nr:right-handed parallel beta-helix repeat-containing protein [bacterium]HOX86929.1 right-handed parallel beta-helix repeat-containing protein [bacterium]HPG46260.1 right-handed parallel beta-helix repeat-containing protein [bacterium]HPM98546.1 right-handed parallel beta-helix repeat-containing protein [bacterium]